MSEWGAPGKVPPVLTGSAAAVPPAQEWDAEGDIAVPLAGAEALYVPSIVRAPPQLPLAQQHPRAPDFEARGYEAFFTPANAGLTQRQLNFTARAVQVDNYSNQWLFFAACRKWIAPASIGWVLMIYPGTAVASFTVSAPGTHANGTVGAATDPVVTVWHEIAFAFSGGVFLTV